MKTLKNNILLLVLLTISLAYCSHVPPNPAEHLYLWESEGSPDVFFVMSLHKKSFNPTYRTMTEYINKRNPVAYNSVNIFDSSVTKDKIKEIGVSQDIQHSAKFIGFLNKYSVPDNIKENPLYSSVETDKNKIEYYSMSILARTTTEETLSQRLYLRQDTPTDSIDVLAINTDNTIDFQHTFISPPEYVFIAERSF